MQIYRIETQNQEGPYSSGPALKLANELTLEPERHPSPETDPKLEAFWTARKIRKPMVRVDFALYEKPKWVFGFLNQTQLTNWYTVDEFMRLDEIAKGADKPLMIGIYEVDGRTIKKSDFQVLFRHEDANLVKQIPLGEFIKSLTS